jgi:hypothetical protein
MKKQATLFFLALFISTFALNSKAQTSGQGSQYLPSGSSTDDGTNHAGHNKELLKQ